jgi:hypothetical protein
LEWLFFGSGAKHVALYLLETQQSAWEMDHRITSRSDGGIWFEFCSIHLARRIAPPVPAEKRA